MDEKILIIDDEQDICMLIQGLLEDEGYQCITASNSDQGYALIESESPDLIIQDIWLQGSADDGIEILKKVKKSSPDLPFIMISGHGTIDTAVSAIKLGAYDFIEKPFQSDRLLLMIHRALENVGLRKQNAELKKRKIDQSGDMLRQIPENIRHMLDKAANSNSRIFITGDVGVGKNIAAQYVHEKSERSDLPFMVFNCANSNPDKMELELFGSVEGATGLLELVNGGVLLLDEVMNLPIEMQGKILVLLQDGAYCKMGSNHKIPLDIRVIATTSSDVQVIIDRGTFREDLYYRLNVVPIYMPNLAQRRSDIPELVGHYSNQIFSPLAMAKLQSYDWSGNIKQLLNVLEWLDIMNDAADCEINIEDLPPEFTGAVANSDGQARDDNTSFIDTMLQMGLREARECFERHYLLSQVNRFDGNISKTAEFIGMERSALHRKLKSLDVFADEKQHVA